MSQICAQDGGVAGTPSGNHLFIQFLGGPRDSNDVFVQLMKVNFLFSLQILLKSFSDAVKPNLLLQNNLFSFPITYFCQLF